MAIRVGDALAAGVVVIQPAWQTFEEAVSGLVDELVAARRLPTSLRMTAAQRIREREAIANTAMVDIGVSIPHARLEGIAGIIAGLAVSPTMVYQVADRLPISIVALVLSPPSLTGEHLDFLSSLSMLLQSGRNRAALRAATTPEDVARLVRANELVHG